MTNPSPNYLYIQKQIERCPSAVNFLLNAIEILIQDLLDRKRTGGGILALLRHSHPKTRQLPLFNCQLPIACSHKTVMPA